jgi:hypothetical protein
MTNVVVGSGFTSIGDSVFDWCGYGASFHCRGGACGSIGSNPFCIRGTTLYYLPGANR